MFRSEKYDVIIIGAGPGGLKAAETLGNASKKVLLLEKNTEIGTKICAGGLTPKDFELGIPESEADHLYREISFHTPKRDVVVKMDKPFVATIDRRELGQYMLRRIKSLSSVEVHTSAKVTNIDQKTVTVNGEKIEFDYLIGADGATSIVRRFLKLPFEREAITMQYIVPKSYPRLELFVDVDKFGPWYAWIFPHKNYTSIGTGGDPNTIPADKLRKNFEDWIKEMKIDVSQGRFEGWAINVDYRGYEFDNIFLVGAAAGMTSALTGEGIYPAMVSGMEVAKKILDPRYSCPKLKRILKVKRKHERIARIMLWNNHSTKWGFEILAILLKNKWLTKQIIDFAA